MKVNKCYVNSYQEISSESNIDSLDVRHNP